MLRFYLVFLVVLMVIGICAAEESLFSKMYGLYDLNDTSLVRTSPLDQVPATGPVHALWIICAPDSHALIASRPVTPPDSCNMPMNVRRVRMPSTYRMPYWQSRMLDTTDATSFASYMHDQSNGTHHLWGDVIGRTANTIFLSDPDTNVAPIQPFTCWGNNGGRNFYRNIMHKVDSLVDFSQYCSNGSQYVDCLIFNIYGLCEAGNCQGTGGVEELPDTFTTNDVTPTGMPVRIADWSGIVIWTPSVEVSRPDTISNYWTVHGLIAHEYSHAIGMFWNHWGQWSRWVGCKEYDGFLGFGGFDPLSGGFADTSTYLPGPPSPLNAVARSACRWINFTNVTAPLTNYSLGDMTGANQLLKVSADVPYGGQFFYVQAATRQSLWERNWPGQGVIIYHQDGFGSNWNYYHKGIDPELSSGLWSWDTTWQAVNPAWQSPVCSLKTATNLVIPNPVTGADSFDFVWAHGNDGFAHSMFENRPVGGRGNYFMTGDRFDYSSNPSSNAHEHPCGVPCPQSVPTMVSVQVLSVDPNNHRCIVNVWGRHWSGNVTASATWVDSVVVDNDLTIASGATLTISPGTRIKILPGKSIEINGRVVIQGTTQSPVVFDVTDTTHTWEGISIGHNSFNNVIDHVIVRRANTGVAAYSGSLTLTNSKMEKCGIGVCYGFATGTMSSDTIQYCNDSGILMLGGNVTMSGCYVHDNKLNGVQIIMGQYAMSHCTVEKNGIGHDTTSVSWGGVELWEGHLNTTCNAIRNNEGPGVYIWGGFTNMANGKWNAVCNNMVASNLLHYDYGQIHLNGGMVSLVNGINSIYSDPDTGRLVWNSSVDSICMNMGGNYWGTTDTLNIERRLPPGTGYRPFYSGSYYCGTMPPDTAAIPVDLVMFNQGYDQEHQGLFETACVTYDSLIRAFPKSKYAEVAAKRYYFCKVAENWSWSQTRTYFLNLAANPDSSKDQSLVNQCKTTAAWCLIEGGDYDNGRIELQALVDSSTKEQDKIRNQIALMVAELKERYSSLDDVGASATGREQAAKARRIAASLHDLVRGLNDLDSGEGAVAATPAVPSRYALYQNYPNPFNPTTELRFDMPEAAHVELKVFNTLGQLVTTLVNEARPAGSYCVTWDGKGASAGMYIYQLKAGNFTDAKKMVLIK